MERIQILSSSSEKFGSSNLAVMLYDRIPPMLSELDDRIPSVREAPLLHRFLSFLFRARILPLARMGKIDDFRGNGSAKCNRACCENDSIDVFRLRESSVRGKMKRRQNRSESGSERSVDENSCIDRFKTRCKRTRARACSSRRTRDAHFFFSFFFRIHG